VGQPDLQRRVADLEREIEAVAERFADAAARGLGGALDRAVEGLVVAQSDRVNALGPDALDALRRGIRGAADRAAGDLRRRLLERDLWLHPTVTLERGPHARLDQPNHRAWIAILRAAAVLDPVLTEFRLAPSETPSFGGSRFGLQPSHVGDLDGAATIERLWHRYVELHERYREALRRIPEEEERRGRDEALRRWRETE
jgi:hypothetical protein